MKSKSIVLYRTAHVSTSDRQNIRILRKRKKIWVSALSPTK